MPIDEPDIQSNNRPEARLQKAVVCFLRETLSRGQTPFELFEFFGFDIAIYFPSLLQWKFIELKAYVGSRNGGVGVGNRFGVGTQIDFLMLDEGKLQKFNNSVKWILVNGTKPRGSKRFAFFDSIKAKNSIMRNVERSKQNNLHVNDFKDLFATWQDLCDSLKQFVLPAT